MTTEERYTLVRSPELTDAQHVSTAVEEALRERGIALDIIAEVSAVAGVTTALLLADIQARTTRTGFLNLLHVLEGELEEDGCVLTRERLRRLQQVVAQEES